MAEAAKASLEAKIEEHKKNKVKYVQAMKMSGLIQNELDPRVEGFITILANLESK